MKRVLFLQDLGLTRPSTSELLAGAAPGYEPIWQDDPDIDQARNDVKILVTSEHRLTAEQMSAWPELKMLSLAFTGYDEVDLEYAASMGIKAYYVPGYATSSVVELNVALVLSILRKIPLADRTIRAGEWHDRVYPGIELANKTVGIVGTGTIGLRTAEVFRAFGCSLIGWSRTVKEEFIRLGGAYVSREKLFSESDVVILCLALNEHTKHFVGESELNRMKEGAVLINTARSNLIDNGALLNALSRTGIFAGIDVFEHEPERGENHLFGMENVVLTPHIGFKTRESLLRLAEQSILNIKYFIEGNETNRIA